MSETLLRELRDYARSLRRLAENADLPGYAERMNQAADDLEKRIHDLEVTPVNIR